MPRKPKPRNIDPEIINRGLSMIPFELVRITRHKDKYCKVISLVNRDIVKRQTAAENLKESNKIGIPSS